LAETRGGSPLSRRRFNQALIAGALAGGAALIHERRAAAQGGLTQGDAAGEGQVHTMLTTQDTGLQEALERTRVALAAMGSGDPEPYIALFPESEDVTLFGAWGPIERGYQNLVDTYRWVGGRFSGGALVPEDTIVHQSGDLAYTVGFERGVVSVDGGELRPMTLRVTHIYRRLDGDWRLVHRHADFPPPDQRQGMR
jgi:ketosteroid isomerase-like protein